jgi:hypothetical protein
MMRYVAVVLVMGTAMAATTYSTVTYDKDVLRIMQRNGQSLHRPGDIGPSSFLNYQSTRPWAKAMPDNWFI